jgi:hypothetical protein
MIAGHNPSQMIALNIDSPEDGAALKLLSKL